jgi:hypothetical protein
MTHTSPTGAPNHDLFCVCLPSCFKNEALEVVTKMLPAEGSPVVAGAGGEGVGAVRCGVHGGGGGVHEAATTAQGQRRDGGRSHIVGLQHEGGRAREGGTTVLGRRCEGGRSRGVGATV